MANVLRILQRGRKLLYWEMKKSFFLTDGHKKDRVEWATKIAEWGLFQWQKVIFSDEKESNLDGADGLACYKNVISKDERVFSRWKGGSECDSVRMLFFLWFM